jgi:hypothetical protein
MAMTILTESFAISAIFAASKACPFAYSTEASPLAIAEADLIRSIDSMAGFLLLVPLGRANLQCTRIHLSSVARNRDETQCKTIEQVNTRYQRRADRFFAQPAGNIFHLAPVFKGQKRFCRPVQCQNGTLRGQTADLEFGAPWPSGDSNVRW